MSSGSELDLMQSTDFDDGSSNDLTPSTHLEFRDGTKPLITKTGSGHMSPVRARTMKEYDQQIAELQKENFSLKLRIYFLEERMKNQSDGDADAVFKQNIELKVEVESLKRDVIDKQELLKKASSALTSVTSHHQTELQQTKDVGIAEGQQMAHSELEAVKLCIEGLRKELNAKNEEVENLVIQSKETETKLSDLLTINRQLDSRWRQLEREKNSLEMRLEMLSSAEQMTTAEEESHETPLKGVADEVVRKDRLIEQLRCALKAKDVIIEQVEEEKKETIKETTMQLQKKILELQARVEQEAPEEIQLTVESFKDGGRSKSAAGTTESEGTRMQKERKVTRKPVLLHAEVQTMVFGQTKDLERLQGMLSAKEEQLAALNLSLSQHQMENERLKKQIGRRDREVVQLMDQLEKADGSLKKQEDQMKELRSSLQEERHKNTDKMLELDVQYKALLDDGQQHLANQNEMILRLTHSLRQKDEQLEKMLQLSSLADASKTTKVAEILRDLQKQNEEAVEELIAENSLNVKSKNEEIGHLKKSLRQLTDDYGRTRKELAVCRQMIADMETKARLTDQTVQQMANALRDQQMELKAAEDHHGRDISGREKLIRQLMASLPNKDKPLQTSQAPHASDALVSAHSGSAEANDLLSDLQNQLKVKEDQLLVAETRLHNLTVEMNCLRETLLKYRYSESSLVNPESGSRTVRAKDRSPVRGAQDVDSVRTSKDSGILSSTDSEPLLSLPEKLSVSVGRDQAQEIDQNERFQVHGMSARMTTAESSNLHRTSYEDKSLQTDKVSTADEEEIIRLQAEIKHLKTLVNQTVAMDSRGNSLTGSPEDRKISTSRAGKRQNQIASPTDDVDTGAMDVSGENMSSRISSQGKHKVQARRHLTLPPAELSSTSQDIQTDHTLLSEYPVAGGSPNLNGSFGRECRTTPPRSNISYLSVESSKRWSLEDALVAERSGLEGDGVGQMMNSFIGALSSFQALLPDDSTLSEMSNAELKDVISDMKQKVWNQRKTLPQGTSLSHVSSSDASSQSHLVSPLGNVSSHSRTDYDSTKLRHLEEKLSEKEQEISRLNLRLEKLRTELSKSQQTVETLENESQNHQCKSQDLAVPALESEVNQLRDELKSSERRVSQSRPEYDSTKLRELEEKLSEKEQEISRLNLRLEKLRTELSKSQQTVQTLENESRNHQHKSQDSAVLALEGELNRLRDELKSSERRVSQSRPEYDSTKLRELEKKLSEKEQEVSSLNLGLEKLRTELSKSQQTVQTLENESRNHQRKSQDSAVLALEGELNRLRDELKSSERKVSQSRPEYDSTKLRELQKKLSEKEQEISGLNLGFEKLRTELSKSQQTVQTLENESQNRQCKSQDAAVLALEGELNRLRDELKSSERRVSQSRPEYDSSKLRELEKKLSEKEQENSGLNLHLEKLRTELSKSQQTIQKLENESRNHQCKSQDSAMLVLESEVNRLRDELQSSERTVHLLKEQIELNTQVGKSSVGFNPELIVRMAKEIDKMKKELAMKNKNIGDAQSKGMDHADRSLTSRSHQTTQKIDRATLTDNLADIENGQPVTPSGKKQTDGSKMDMEDLTDTRQKEGWRIVVSDGKKGVDEIAVELRSTGLDDLVETGNRILNKSSSGSVDGKMFSGEKKSQIPVLKKSSRSLSLDSESIENESRKSQIPLLRKSSRSLSLDGENNENESDAVKYLQLETKTLMLEATIVSQSKQISDYQSRLKELGHQRSLESQLQSGSATPVSLHAASMLSKDGSIMDREVQRNDSSTATDDPRLCSDSKRDVAEKIQGARSSEVTDGSFGLDEIAYKMPSGDHDMSSDLLHQGSGVVSTPFNDTKAANDRAFVQLKNEVQTLKAQLEMCKRENSRLNDTLQMYNEQSLWMPGSSPSVHDASSRSRGTSASAEEFLRHRMELKRVESELQCHLDESHRNCDLLRTRLEELLLFMEDLLPLIDTSTPTRLASLKGKLNETRSLLADVSQSFNNTYDSSSMRMSQTGSFLSRLDLDSNSTTRIEEEDRSYHRSSHSLIHSANSRDFTLSEGTSDAELGRQQLQMEVSSLDRISCELQQHLRQKELELASVVTEAANSKSQVAELLDEMEMLRMNLQGEEEKTSVMKTELVDLKQCNESLAKTLEDTRQKLTEIGLERDSLDKTNHHLQATLAEHNAKVSNLEQELVDCEARRVKELHQVEEDQLRRMAAFEQEHSLLISKIELLTAEIQELKIEIIRERDRSAAAEVARNSCVEKLEDKDNIIRKLKELVKENQTTAEDLGNQLHRLNADIHEKKLTILKLNKKCEDLRNSLHQSDISSSMVRTGSLSEMASTPSTNQLHDIQSLKGSKVATEGLGSTKEPFRPPGGSTKGERSVSGDHETSILSSKDSNENRVDHHHHHHPDKNRVLSPTKDYLDHKPTRDTSDSISGGHPSIIPSGMKLNDPIIFQGGKIPSSISTLVSHDRSAGAGSLELQLVAAQDTIRLLQMELKIYKQRKRSEDAKGEEIIEELEEETLEEAMEEIKQLRIQLEQSVQKNDQLRDLLTQQAKQTGGDDSLHTAQSGTLSNSREMLHSTRELDMAQREISMYKARISRLQSDLSQKATQIEAIQVEKNSVQRTLSATKLKLETAVAETRKLKEALDESNELNRTMRLELRLQEMMTKADNKENERGLSVSPSRRSSSGSPSRLQLSDLMTEIRQLRIQMEKTIENNNVLRQKLEEVSQNPLPSQSGSTKISDSSTTKLSSASAVLRATETTNEGSVVDGIYGSQSPKAASLVPASSRHVAMEGKKRDFSASAVTDSSSTDQLVFVVADREVYERLKEEVSLNQVAIGKLEESIRTIHSQVIEDNRKKDLSEVIQKLRTIANEQMQLITLFWFLNLLKPDKKTTDTTRVVENELLRKQLADLRQRYARAKHAMKGAQERLEANNRKKEEFFTMQKNKKEQAILEQISKTHQVLAQARQNLEAVHQQTSS